MRRRGSHRKEERRGNDITTDGARSDLQMKQKWMVEKGEDKEKENGEKEDAIQNEEEKESCRRKNSKMVVKNELGKDKQKDERQYLSAVCVQFNLFGVKQQFSLKLTTYSPLGDLPNIAVLLISSSMFLHYPLLPDLSQSCSSLCSSSLFMSVICDSSFVMYLLMFYLCIISCKAVFIDLILTQPCR